MGDLDDFLTPTLARQLQAEEALCTATRPRGWGCSRPRTR